LTIWERCDPNPNKELASKSQSFQTESKWHQQPQKTLVNEFCSLSWHCVLRLLFYLPSLISICSFQCSEVHCNKRSHPVNLQDSDQTQHLINFGLKQKGVSKWIHTYKSWNVLKMWSQHLEDRDKILGQIQKLQIQSYPLVELAWEYERARGLPFMRFDNPPLLLEESCIFPFGV
jgi:hypothetical protein